MATVVGTPTTTVSFVAGGSLHTVNSDQAGAAATATAATGTGEEGTEDATALALKSLDQVIAQAKSNSGHAGAKSTEVRPVEMPVSLTQRTPSPIGEEFVIDVPPKEGKPASFFCKLCQCPIGDRVARGQHVRGKRHRFAYKTNVDPSIEAETYPKIKPLPAAAASTANAGSPLETDNVSSPPAPRGPPNAPSSSYKSNRMTKALPMPKCNNNWNRREHCGLGWFTNPPRYVTHPPNPHHFAPRAPMSMNRPYGRMPMPPSYRMPGRYFAPSFPPQQPPMPMTGLRPRLPPPPPIPEPMHMQTLDTEEMEPELIYTNDDHLLMQKHSLICPTQREVDTIFHHLNVVEKALKLVSDDLMTPVTQETEEANKVEEKFNPDPSEVIEKGPVSSPSTGDKEDSQLQSVVNLGKKSSPVKSSADQAAASGSQDRILKGLIRVGPAAKELLLLGDDEAHIVVICSEKPTKALQDRVMDRLAHHLQVCL